MTSATLHLVGPTAIERRALQIAGRITRLVEARIAHRAERRMIALDLLREQQSRRHAPIRYERALSDLGSRLL